MIPWKRRLIRHAAIVAGLAQRLASEIVLKMRKGTVLNIWRLNLEFAGSPEIGLNEWNAKFSPSDAE
jgi:hypothetical protein